MAWLPGTAIAAILITALLLPGCSSQKADQVSIGIAAEPTALNPVLPLNSEARQIISLIFDGLSNPIGLTGDLRQEFVPALAQSIREADPRDRRLLTVELKPGIKWHDGSNFRASDVYFTWEAIHQSNSPLTVRLDRFVDEIRVRDDQTLDVRLREERIAERVMDILSFKIIPQNYHAPKIEGTLPKNLRAQVAVVNQFNWMPVGTGSYQIEARPSAIELHLAANPLPVLGAPRIQRVQIKRYNGWDVIAKGLTDNSINLAVDVPPEYFPQLDRSALSKQVYSPYNFHSLVYNVRRPPLQDLPFRQALAHATDRAQLATTLLPNEPDVRKVLNESVYPHNFEHVQRNSQAYRTRYPYDPGAARRLLASVPSGGRKLDFWYCSYLDGENANLLAQAYKRMMEHVGVEVVLQNAPNIASYYSGLQNRRFDVAFVLFRDMDHFYDLYDLFEANAPLNYAGFASSPLSDKFADLKLTLAFDDVAKLTREIHTLIDDAAPMTFLFTLPRRAYYSQRMQTLTINPEAYFNLLYMAEYK